MLILAACGAADQSDTSGEKEFKPQGNLSDLVYNPIRSDGTIDSSFLAIISFQDTLHDFGELIEGDIVSHEFTFTNTGTAPLLIHNANSSCGCTVPEWTKEPIKPGETGTIKVEFKSAAPGAQQKTVTIFANTLPNQRQLTIQAQVNPSN